MNPLGNMSGDGPNLFDILVNVVFGFIGGLMILLGFKEVIDYGSKLATSLMGPQMGGGGFAMYAPYVVITPIAGLVVKQLTAVRSIKTFLFFAVAVIIGFAIAFVTQGYFKSLLS